MTIYTTEHCPQCKFLKKKLAEHGIAFNACTEIHILDKKNIKTVPMLELDDGTILNFQAAMRMLDKGEIV